MSSYLPPDAFRRIIAASPAPRPSQPRGCVGHFWDATLKVRVTLDMGQVYVRFSPALRAAPSQVHAVNLSLIEGAAPSADLPFLLFTEAEWSTIQNGGRVVCNTRPQSNGLDSKC